MKWLASEQKLFAAVYICIVLIVNICCYIFLTRKMACPCSLRRAFVKWDRFVCKFKPKASYDCYVCTFPNRSDVGPKQPATVIGDKWLKLL